MTEPVFDPTTLNTAGDVTLLLGKRTSTKFKGFRIKMHPDVRETLRAVATYTAEMLSTRTPIGYSDDLAFDAEEQYVLIQRDSLVVHRPEPRRRGGSSADSTPEPQIVEMDPAVLEVLDAAASADEITRATLKRQSFPFYAAVIGDDPADRIAFLKERNPYQVGQLGKVLTQFGDGLRRLNEPILMFANDFDLVVTRDHIAVIRKESFEKLFRDIDALRERIPVWSTAAVQALPLSDESASVLRAAALNSVRVASQLRGLQERGFLGKTYTTDQLREMMIEIGLEHERLIPGDTLTLTNADVPVLLKLIDEKLYIGWHSSTPWDVGTRARR
jgi:hypothetical protein